MKKIYFDNNLIDENYYARLTRTGTMFNENFKLGSTVCETYKFDVDKSQIEEIPEKVEIYEDNELIKTLYVDSYEEEDFTINFELTDAMLNFNIPYDASTIFVGGKTTLLDIFNDICEKAGITTDIESFDYDDMEVSWFDNTLMARDYLSFIGEINASYFYITADDKLTMSKINKEEAMTYSFDEIGNYKIGPKHQFSRVVWDDGLNHWEYGDDTADTYYINISNVYVINAEIVENIYNEIEDFEFYDFEVDNLPTNNYMAGEILVFTDGVNEYKTITQYSELYLSRNDWFGGISLKVDTSKQEETQIIDTARRIKTIKNIVDRDSNTITTLITDTQDIKTDLRENYYTLQQTNELVQNSATGITNTFSQAGGNNIFRNTGLWFSAVSTEATLFPSIGTYPSDETFTGNQVYYEFWNGKVEKVKEDKSANMIAMLLVSGDLFQEQTVPNGKYTISFKYKKLIELANVTVKINNVVYELTETEDTDFTETINVTSQHINVVFLTDIDESCEIYDLMVNAGEVALAYSQNQNETTTDTVNISKGITITSTNTGTIFKADSTGIKTLDRSENVLTEFTDTGMTTKEAIIQEKSQIVGTLWQEVGNQTWITRL